MKSFKLIVHIVLLSLFIACSTEKEQTKEKEFKVEFTKFTLDNGLKVIYHIDRSDPVVAVALTSHVGSAREVEGRTGFAHLFEHLLFLESENLGKGGLDQMSARIGGSGANGSTSRDRTNYFQTVPKDALEKMIWAEADKLGFFINTVTEPVLAKEKQVVKNEKRQGVDNQPYGHTFAVIGENLYPEGHPYSWEVIGSLEDLQQATLQDVKDFFNRWYVPNNVTLTISGDFDPDQATAWVKHYFDEIPAGEAIPAMEKQPVALTANKLLYYEDNFARLPELTYAWPGVHMYHPDSYALEVLTQYLSQGKRAPLYKKLVEELQLTDGVGMFNYNSEIAGQTMLSVTGYDKVDLNEISDAIDQAFANFEENGIAEEDLNRIKAGQETAFYNGLSSVLGKGFQLAQYEIFAGDPGYISEDVQRILDVTAADVMKVYNTYIKDKNFVATSFVPKGQTELALKNSVLANVTEELIVEGAEDAVDPNQVATYEKTPSSFDRSQEPPYGESPDVVVPEIWKQELNSGMRVFGIENHEVPLVQFEVRMKGGMLLENSEKIGVSNMMAQLMTRGTVTRTPEELESLIESLGASIRMNASDQAITISGNTLAKNYDQVMGLVTEILVEPRWDEKEFELIKQSVLSTLQRQKANPNSIAGNEFAKILYGEDHLLSNNNLGTVASVNAINIDDLKAYYTNSLTPQLAVVKVVGSISEVSAVRALETLDASWEVKDVNLPTVAEAVMPEKSTIYFYDIPGAKQSVIYFGHPALKVTDPDYYAASVMNYRLGGGGFASQLTQELREGKGYTYGIGSGFAANAQTGYFRISSGVRSNVTFESTALVKTILENYGPNFNENDLDVTRSFTIKSGARAFESLRAKLNMLSNISDSGLSENYVKEREEIVKAMTVDEVKRLASLYIKPDNMIYLIVGDAATQLDKLEGIGFGKPVLLNKE